MKFFHEHGKKVGVVAAAVVTTLGAATMGNVIGYERAKSDVAPTIVALNNQATTQAAAKNVALEEMCSTYAVGITDDALALESLLQREAEMTTGADNSVSFKPGHITLSSTVKTTKNKIAATNTRSIRFAAHKDGSAQLDVSRGAWAEFIQKDGSKEYAGSDGVSAVFAIDKVSPEMVKQLTVAAKHGKYAKALGTIGDIIAEATYTEEDSEATVPTFVLKDYTYSDMEGEIRLAMNTCTTDAHVRDQLAFSATHPTLTLEQ